MSISVSHRYRELMKFRQFRLNLIGFLRLPPNVEERALRETIHERSQSLLAGYMERVQRAREFVSVREPVVSP